MAFTILYSIKDGKGAVSTTEVPIPSSVSFTDATIFAADLASLIDAVITGAITRIGIAFTVDLPGGLTAVPAGTSDVEEGARFQFRTDGGFYKGMRLPTFTEGLINAGSRDVDLTDLDVIAFYTAITDGLDTTGGGGSGVVQPSDSREDDIVDIEYAREQFLSSRG